MYMAVSVDGFAADEDGGVGFLGDFQDLDYGYADFITRVAVITMGRRSFDQILTFGDWPYPGHEVLVQTSRPIGDPPRGCAPWRGSPQELIAAWRKGQARRPGDLWVLGGPRLCAAYLEADLIDRLDLFFMPVLLGRGLPLFTQAGGRRPVELAEQRAFDNGVVHLAYQRPRPAARAPFLGRKPAPAPASAPEPEPEPRES